MKPTSAQRITLRQPVPPKTTESWWAKFAIGPIHRAGLQYEADVRFPGSDCGNVRLKIWAQE